MYHFNGIYIQRGGSHHLNGTFIRRGGVYHLNGPFMQRGDVHHLNGIFIKRGGVYHLYGIFIQRGGSTTSAEYFPLPPIFPNAPFFHPVFFWGGGVPMCCMVSHSSQLSIFTLAFLLVGGCVGGGDCQAFPCPFLTGRKEGRGRVPHFYQTFPEMCSILCP